MKPKMDWSKIEVEKRVLKNGTEESLPEVLSLSRQIRKRSKTDPEVRKFLRKELLKRRYAVEGKAVERKKQKEDSKKERRLLRQKERTEVWKGLRKKLKAALPPEKKKVWNSDKELRRSIHNLADRLTDDEMERRDRSREGKSPRSEARSRRKSRQERQRMERERIAAIEERRRTFVPEVAIVAPSPTRQKPVPFAPPVAPSERKEVQRVIRKDVLNVTTPEERKRVLWKKEATSDRAKIASFVMK